jgi:chemotaxis protein CheZ
MAMPRKIFRIEQGGAGAAEAAPRDEAALRHDEFMTEIRELRRLIEPAHGVTRDVQERVRAQIAEAHAFRAELELIAAAMKRTRGELAGGPGPDGLGAISRAGRELNAIVAGTEQATQQVLRAAEEIDQTANTLSAALKSGHERGLASDIRDQVVKIYEACNFQDLTGQRIAQVTDILAALETHVARLAEIWSAIECIEPAAAEPPAGDRRFLNGPKLEGDGGHFSQSDIDAIFHRA